MPTIPSRIGALAERLAIKATGSMASGYATGDSPVSLFTVTGDVLVNVFGVVTTTVTSTSNTGTLEVGIAGNTAFLLPQDVVTAADFAATDVWSDNDATVPGKVMPGSGAYYIVGGGLDIILTIATNSMTAGAISFYCLWKPLSEDGLVVPA